MTFLSILRAIRSMDPDGWNREPTADDYREFRAWAILTYGDAAWDDYHTAWEPKGFAGE